MATIGISTSCFYPAETEKALRTALLSREEIRRRSQYA